MVSLIFLCLDSREVAELFLALIIGSYSELDSSLSTECFTAARLRLSLGPSLPKMVEGALSMLIV